MPRNFSLLVLSLVFPWILAGCGATVHSGAPPASVPTVTIGANPTSVNAGGAATLTVTATDATSVTIAGSDGSSYTLAAAGGTQSVTPAATTTYTATAKGPGGTMTASATVAVAAPAAPAVSITANPPSIVAGASSTLTVTATHATTVTITGSDGTSYPLGANGGTQDVSPTVTTTYTAAAINGSVHATTSTTVTVTAAAATASVYVATSPTVKGGNPSLPASVQAYAAAADGTLSLVQSTPLGNNNETMAAVSGSYLVTEDPGNLHAYTLASNGAVGSQAAQVSTQSYGGSECGPTTGASVLDRTGKLLTVELWGSTDSNGNHPCDAWQTYQITAGGQFSFTGDLDSTYGYHGNAAPLGIAAISGNNQFAYGAVDDVYAIDFTAFQRGSAGDLVSNPSFSQTGPVPDPSSADGNFFPVLITADATNHLAVVMNQAFSNNSGMWLASFTIDSTTGAITSTNTWQNIPAVTITSPDTIAISPSGQEVAVGAAMGSVTGATGGVQVFHFNGASPPTAYSGTLLPHVSISQVAWDNNGHLYALSRQTGALYAFTVSATNITPVPGSPWTIPNAAALIVAPQP